MKFLLPIILLTLAGCNRVDDCHFSHKKGDIVMLKKLKTKFVVLRTSNFNSCQYIVRAANGEVYHFNIDEVYDDHRHL